MKQLIRYTPEDLKKHTRWRWGETKMGQVLSTLPENSSLADHPARFVLLGIPEDIGVRANYGRPGAALAWNSFMDAFCNIQSNQYFKQEELLVLGTVACQDLMRDTEALQEDDPFFPTKIGGLVKELDARVSAIVKTVVQLDKIPVVIGGGHNNALGLLQGAFEALGKPINCINFDAHTDFRPTEHRHSGNGFSYARESGFMDRYFMMGLHRNYTSEAIWNLLESDPQCRFEGFEDWLQQDHSKRKEQYDKIKKWIGAGTFGIEVDLDCIAGMGSSAMSPTGFTLENIRAMLLQLKGHKNLSYLHFCEGAPAHEQFVGQVGKTLAALVSDQIATK